MREAGNAAPAGLVRLERPGTWMHHASIPAECSGDDRVALGVSLVDTTLPALASLDPGRNVGVSRLDARKHVHRRLQLLAAELGEPCTELGDEIECKPVPSGRDRRAYARLDDGLLVRREVRDVRSLAVPDQRVSALVQPVIPKMDAVAPLDVPVFSSSTRAMLTAPALGCSSVQSSQRTASGPFAMGG